VLKEISPHKVYAPLSLRNFGTFFGQPGRYYLLSTSLESVDVIKDLAVVFDSELSFVSHCKEKINRAYSMLGLIKRNFIYFTFVTLYKSLVRCHLEVKSY